MTTPDAVPERANPTASSSASSEQCAPATLGQPGKSACAAAIGHNGRPTSNALSTSRGFSIKTIGPSHT
ncbi:MAG: hypothetical protein M3535_11425, partial [Actinomycetota bacterium]|nr:hypothetical protein [Actinomycetota bacterium]